MKEYVITVVETDDPSLLRFELNEAVTSGKTYDYHNIDQAKGSPLAQQLFYLPFIKRVYIGPDHIELQRFNIVEWDDVKEEVAQQLVDYLNSGGPVVTEETDSQKIAITLYAEVTPNPNVMKFVANSILVPGMYEYKNVDATPDSGLARALFGFDYVHEIFMDTNYVSVTKSETSDWNEVTLELREFIRDFVASGQKIDPTDPHTMPQSSGEKSPEIADLDETSQQIVTILEEYVKPAVASDGGNILFDSYNAENKTVSVILQGACSGCPSSTFTLKNGIEQMLKNMLDDKVEEVIAINA